ncbi:distal tail protein Dit [Peribacillus frigoritolerans]|uniref:distal tail protein Dit n=1 Tax=Peribacillus frigoritolerans TaxID=450367 RepID=UPI00203B3854|nr:distal tail protein Dit [Peribacillus frigoritolerans]MCM3169023.1 phage tail family protein [Peribacillus frigoritolerans]
MNSFTFDGISKPYLTVLKDSNRQPWAPIEWTYQDVHKRPGALPVKKNTGVRALPLPVFLKGKSIEDLQKVKEDLAEWLIHDEPRPLIFDDEPDRIYYAVVDGSFDPDEILKWGQGVIPFICPDPYKYGEEESLILGDFPIRNVGTLKTNPVFSIKFMSNTTNYTVSINEKTLKVIWDFKQNDLLIIDTNKRKIIINNLVKMTALDLSSKWPEFIKGQNNIIADKTVANITVTFRPRWL